MSSADAGDKIPETVIHSRDTDAVHRTNGGKIEPACIARLHHVDDGIEWLLTTSNHTDESNHCQHPECFGGDQ